MSSFRALLAAATVLAGLSSVIPAQADDTLTSPRVPPDPTLDQVESNVPDLANPLNKPITGGSEQPLVVGTEPPPSLETLQAARPGDDKGDGLEPGRADMVRTAALTYGAQGGLAGRSFALNEMLRRHQAELDSAYDFRVLVLPVGAGQTMMRPPIVSAAQMAFALVHLPDHARSAARLGAAELEDLSRQVLVQPAPATGRHPAPHQAGGCLLEQMGGGGLGVRREAGG
jgi:defect-in-organelle-trafficking protein DotC